MIFLRKERGSTRCQGPVPSEWIGTPAGKHQKQLAGKGEMIMERLDDRASTSILGLLTPSNLRKTALVGGNGGGPFTSTGDGESPIVGLRISPGNWNGPVIGHIQPLYDRAGNDPPSSGMTASGPKCPGEGRLRRRRAHCGLRQGEIFRLPGDFHPPPGWTA